MAIIKLIEVEAQSDKSWEDAVKSALAGASQTVRNIHKIHIKDFTAEVADNKITNFKIDATIAFRIDR